METLNTAIYQVLKTEAENYFSEISEHLPTGTYTPAELTKYLSDLVLTEINGKIKNTFGYIKVKNEHLFSASSADLFERTIGKYEHCGKIAITERKYIKQPFVKSIENKNGLNGYVAIITAYNSGKQMNIQVGTFKLSFDACKVFDYLERFRTTMKIKDTPQFIKKENEKPLMSFDLEITKENLSICKYTSVDELRPVQNQIYLSLEYHTLVATDGHILGEQQALISNLQGEQSTPNIYIHPKHLKKCKGKCKVEQYENRTIITNSKGERFENVTTGEFPKWKTVIPQVIDHKIEPIDSKEMSKFVLGCQKLKGASYRFTIQGTKDEKYLELDYIDRDFEESRTAKIELKNTLEYSFLQAFSIDTFLRLENFDCFYISDQYRPVLFEGIGYSLLMPVSHEKAFVDSELVRITHDFQHSTYNVLAIERPIAESTEEIKRTEQIETTQPIQTSIELTYQPIESGKQVISKQQYTQRYVTVRNSIETKGRIIPLFVYPLSQFQTIYANIVQQEKYKRITSVCFGSAYIREADKTTIEANICPPIFNTEQLRINAPP